MIDTGSEANFCSPRCKLIVKKWSEPFTIQTANKESKGNECCFIRIEHLSNELIPCKIFEFSPKYDILIGVKTLQEIKATIDLSSQKLKTPYQTYKLEGIKKIPILKGLNKIRIPAVNNPDGTYMIEATDLPPGIADCKQNTFHLEFHSDKAREICIDNLSITELEEENPYPDIRSLVRTNHLIGEDREQLLQLLVEYRDLFQLGQSLSCTDIIEHKIETTDDNPVYSKNYRYPYAFYNAIQDEVEKLITNKIIQTSNSPYNSPIWVVPKKRDASGQQKIRLVIDYRKLNLKTKDDRFPLPNIEDIFGRLGQSTYFSTIDLASGFHQINIRREDRHKTAFSTDKGHFEFLRMPFGLKNGPPTFQRAMTIVLADVPNALVYLDDIIIFSHSFEEHLKDLKRVLTRLRKHNLKIQIDKTEFVQTELQFLGHVITPDGIKPNPEKIQAIQNFPVPTNEKEIKQFLGLTGYYRKLIKGYAKIASPISNMLRKTSIIDINNEDYQMAVTDLKSAITNEPVLKLPDFSKPFVLTTDASNIAIGGVLSQKFDGIEHPIAFSSRTLSPRETKSDTTEKEVLSVIWNVKHFRPYLYGRKFLIRTDHKPLKWLKELKEPNAKLTRWRLALEEYDFDIEYLQGKENKVADALSRVQLNFNETEQAGLDLREDDDIETIHSQGSSDEAVGIAPPNSSVNKELNQIIFVRGKFDLKSSKIFGKTRLTVQINDKKEIINKLSIIMGFITPRTRYGVHFKLPFPQFEEEGREILLEFIYLINKQILGNRYIIYDTILEDVTEKELQLKLIADTHEGKCAHRGINENYARLKRRYYWPNMCKNVNQYVNECVLCNKVKYDRQPIKVPFQVTPTPNRPFQTLMLDVFSFAETKILTICDVFSKFVFLHPLRACNSICVIKGLRTYLSLYPTPTTIKSDNGTEFANASFKQFADVHNIQLEFASAAHPDSMGTIERMHSTLRDILVSLKQTYPSNPTSDRILQAGAIYNNTIIALHKLTPFELAFGPFQNLRDLDITRKTRAEVTEQIALERQQELQTFYELIKNGINKEKDKRTQELNRDRLDLPEQQLLDQAFVKDTRKRKHLPRYVPAKKVEGNKYKMERCISKLHPKRLKRQKLRVSERRYMALPNDVPDIISPLPDSPSQGPSEK